MTWGTTFSKHFYQAPRVNFNSWERNACITLRAIFGIHLFAPFMSANISTNAIYRSFHRTTPIFFNHLTTSEGEQAEEYMKEKEELFSLASTHSLPQIINLSSSVNKRNSGSSHSILQGQATGLSTTISRYIFSLSTFCFQGKVC